MLLAVDIGNSATKFGVFDNDKLTHKLLIPTKPDLSADKLAETVGDQVSGPIDQAVVCSVVPTVERSLAGFLSNRFQVKPRFLRSTDDLGLMKRFSTETTGTDRLVNSYAAAESYGVPCVIVSLGTATTIDIVNSDREYLGGLIAPGMKLSAQALSLGAVQLPEVMIDKPRKVIAETTQTAIQSGIVYGQIAMVDGLLARVIDELSDDPTVVATGGFAEMIGQEVKAIDRVDEDLTLKGIQMLSQRAI